jgi:hypothetical protein
MKFTSAITQKYGEAINNGRNFSPFFLLQRSKRLYALNQNQCFTDNPASILRDEEARESKA